MFIKLNGGDLMAAIKYSVNHTRLVLLNLRNTDANYAFNSLAVEVISGRTQAIRGFMGVRSDKSLSLEGAICWGHGIALESCVFEIAVTHNKVSFSFTEIPNSFTPIQAEKLLKNLILATMPEIEKRYIKRSLPKGSKKSGGKYNGARLEAWSRTATLPKDKFANAIPAKFTRNFAQLAPKLNVTYR